MPHFYVTRDLEGHWTSEWLVDAADEESAIETLRTTPDLEKLPSNVRYIGGTFQENGDSACSWDATKSPIGPD